jgi:hypothetical protein
MGVDSKHPLYLEFQQDWLQMEETSRSERVVKEQGTKYLPPTAGMVADGVLTGANTDGWKAYRAYRARAVYPELVPQSIESMLGVMHHKPPAIELPEKMEPMREKATLRNESLEMLLRRINENQLRNGRLGLLLEVPNATGIVLPFIALYEALPIINWDDGGDTETDQDSENLEQQSLNMVVLDETGPERKANFEWEEVEKFRVLVLGELDENEPQGKGTYSVAVIRDSKEMDPTKLMQPMIAGTLLDQIPFVFVNTKDIVPEPDEVPLLGLSNLALTIYRGEADYRQALFMQGQDTLVTIGATGNDGETRRMGANAELALPMGGDAKYIGVDSQGLPEMRSALENDYTRGEQRANGLLEAVSRSAESGEALRVRVSARTAGLNQIAMAGAFALQELLRIAAKWVGADPEQVIVTPNLDFVSDRLPGAELVGYMTAKGLGAPLALETIHEIAVERGLTTLTWEDEQKRLEAEAELGLPGAVMPGEDDEGATKEGSPEDEEDEEGEEDEEEEDEESEE